MSALRFDTDRVASNAIQLSRMDVSGDLDRRRFSRGVASLFALATGVGWSLRADDTPEDAAAADRYALWSLLIPIIQTQPGKGYMIADETVIPDALPYAGSGRKKPPLERALEARSQPEPRYETFVPVQDVTEFTEAVSDARQRRPATISVERRLHLPKRYRLLSKTEMKAFSDLSPHAIGPSWRPGPQASRYFKGWHAVSLLSEPFFSRSRRLAIVWAGTHNGSYLTSWFFFRRTLHSWEQLLWPTAANEQTA